MTVPIVCGWCGETFNVFPSRVGKRKHCSKVCFDAAQAGSRPDLNKLADRNCLQCGDLFHPSDNTKRFCSRSCAGSYRFNPNQRGEKNTRTIACERCGTPFKRGSRSNRFCSWECYNSTRTTRPRRKRCTLCGSSYPATHDYFNRAGVNAAGFGLRSACKWCHAAQTRARLDKTRGFYTFNEIWQMYEDQQGLCAYCETPLFGTYHIDHMLPLSRGGRNDWVNLAITCPPCNMQKHDKTAEEFMEVLNGRVA